MVLVKQTAFWSVYKFSSANEVFCAFLNDYLGTFANILSTFGIKKSYAITQNDKKRNFAVLIHLICWRWCSKRKLFLQCDSRMRHKTYMVKRFHRCWGFGWMVCLLYLFRKESVALCSVDHIVVGVWWLFLSDRICRSDGILVINFDTWKQCKILY